MNVLRIFGIVVAVHAFAFLLIMANPGCSTKSKATASVAAPVSAPSSEASPFAPATAPSPEGGLNFDPNAVAGAQGRFSPVRPNTPAAAAVQAEPVAEVTPASTITVGKGDSLWSISKKNGVPVTELAAANNLKTGATLQVGQKLVVPSKSGAKASVSTTAHASGTGHAATASTHAAKAPETASADATAPASAPAAAKVPASGTRHVVKAGETLGTIARKYGVKSGDIAVANNITNPATLRAGRELVIPGTSSAKAAKTQASATEAKPVSNAPSTTSAPAAETAPASQAPVMPVIGGASSEQDLDAGLKSTPSSNVPVIKLDDTPEK